MSDTDAFPLYPHQREAFERLKKGLGEMRVPSHGAAAASIARDLSQSLPGYKIVCDTSKNTPEEIKAGRVRLDITATSDVTPVVIEQTLQSSFERIFGGKP